MEGFEPVARTEDLPAGSLLGVKTAKGEHICLVNDRGTLRAVSGLCSHQEFPLDDGTLLPDGRLECAWHGTVFDLATGAPLQPPAEEAIAVYRVAVVNGMICVGARRK
jgi:3-phenylpropionate/trans-cinnamate dioxygenase ferredoxin subunit